MSKNKRGEGEEDPQKITPERTLIRNIKSELLMGISLEIHIFPRHRRRRKPTSNRFKKGEKRRQEVINSRLETF